MTLRAHLCAANPTAGERRLQVRGTFFESMELEDFPVRPRRTVVI